MRGKLSTEMIQILRDPKGREEIEKALKTGHATVTLGKDLYEITVVGQFYYKPENGMNESHNSYESR